MKANSTSFFFFSKVNVFFETMLQETISEYPEYTFLSFLSSSGGDLSLYIGMTILSFLEIGEFVVRLLVASLKKRTY